MLSINQRCGAGSRGIAKKISGKKGRSRIRFFQRRIRGDGATTKSSGHTTLHKSNSLIVLFYYLCEIVCTYDAIHDFSLLLRTVSNPTDIKP